MNAVAGRVCSGLLCKQSRLVLCGKAPVPEIDPRLSSEEMTAYKSFFYPMHLALLCVSKNFLPMAWWTPVSKEPFRFLLAVDRQNHTLALLRQLGEAALVFPAWEDRTWVVRAGYLSGRQVDKAQKLGVSLRPAQTLQQTFVPERALAIFELHVHEHPCDGDHALFFSDVVHVEGSSKAKTTPILFLGYRDFAPLGQERWRFRP